MGVICQEEESEYNLYIRVCFMFWSTKHGDLTVSSASLCLTCTQTENYLIQCPFPVQPSPIPPNTLRSSWSSIVNETSWSFWKRTLLPAHHLHLAGQESDTSTCPLENWCWLRCWAHWTETNRPKTAEAAHTAFPAKGYGLSFSHISFLMGLSHWLSWRPMGCGSDSSFKVIFNGAHLLVKQKGAVAVFSLYFWPWKKENLIDKQLF